MSVDVLAVGAHPDDVELGVGGILHKLAQRGFSRPPFWSIQARFSAAA